MENTPPVKQEVPQIQKAADIPQKPRQSNNIIIAAVAVLFLIVFALVFLVLGKNNILNINSELTVTPTPSNTASKDGIQNTSDWETYTDSVAGFSFKYPKSVVLNSDNNTDTLSLNVSVDKLSDIPEELPMFMGRKDALAEKERLEKGEGDSLVKIGSLNGQVDTTLSLFEICSVMFDRSVTFYPGEFRVIITLTAPSEEVKVQMPQYFIEDSVNCGTQKIWNREEIPQFEQVLENNQGTGIAQSWYNIFNQIVSTIRLNPPQVTNVISPTINSTPPSYTNNIYGFEISYPASYKALDTKDDLYGYPNGIVLLYAGGQAYDIVVEIWDSKEEYENNYSTRLNDLTVIPYGDKFITLFDNTNSPENKQVINSFKLISN